MAYCEPGGTALRAFALEGPAARRVGRRPQFGNVSKGEMKSRPGTEMRESSPRSIILLLEILRLILRETPGQQQPHKSVSGGQHQVR